jgi:hypothetical protein
MDKLTIALICIILALLIYLAVKPDGSGDYIDMIQQENKKLVKQMEVNQALINARLDSLQMIERKETIIRNYYNEVVKEIGNYTLPGVNFGIREKLDTLGSARFD